MMRILFTCQPASGHWHPLVPLAQAAESSGHEVAFVSTPGFCPHIGTEGFGCFHAGIDESEEDLQQRREQQAARSLRERADYMQAHVFAGHRARGALPDLMHIVREWRPDVVVRENTEYGGCIAAEHAGIPHAAVQITAPRANFLQVIDGPLKHLCALAGLPTGEPEDILYRYLLLSARPPSLWDPEIKAPPTMRAFRYAGFNQSGEERLPDWVAELEQRPTVYATLGTVHNHRTEILESILEGLRDEPINLILTVGRNRDPLKFGEQPPHVHIERYIPQSLLLTRCDLVVTHGGSGTMMDALSHGLPMVIIPGGADQPENAQACAQAGVARVITPGERAELTSGGLSHAIRNAVRDVLRDPRYRENARRLQAEIEELPGLHYPVALLEKLGASRTRPAHL